MKLRLYVLFIIYFITLSGIEEILSGSLADPYLNLPRIDEKYESFSAKLFLKHIHK